MKLKDENIVVLGARILAILFEELKRLTIFKRFITFKREPIE